MASANEKILLLLKKHIGLNSQSIGKVTVEGMLNRRIQECELDSVESYYQKLLSDENELSELLEIAVIPETWFFRDIRPFEFILKEIRKNWLQNHSVHYNILCLPCSTGEEPYSLVMYLLEQGISKKTFNIHGVDVSHRAIEQAQQGRYSNNSFRGQFYPEFQKKYFSNKKKHFYIDKTIKEMVSFKKVNILQKNTELENRFDFILCRNLLIYFDANTKLIAFENLSFFLKDSGHLFIGHSEFGAVPEKLFQNTGSENAFSLVKPGHKSFKNIHTSLLAPIPLSNSTTKKTSTAKTKKEPTPFKKPITHKKTNSTALKISLLDKAKQHANEGDFNIAENLCIKYIKEHNENSDTFYLLGLIASSKDQLDVAESMLRKSVFLEPQHYDSLMHLSLLLEKKGDLKNSKLFKNRADRALTEAGKPSHD